MLAGCVMKCFWLIVFLLRSVRSIPIDNGVEGEPEIECGSNAIAVSFNTRNPFEGHVYVIGHFADQSCRSTAVNTRVAMIMLPFTSCGVTRTRSLNPRGIFVRTSVVVSFHPQFVTKVDRAYSIQCFYMEADKTVSQELEVSMLTTGFQTQTVPMPVCRYEILNGTSTGPPVHFVLVGQQVYHKWTCDSEAVDTFCMLIHSCYVNDGNGDNVDLIDPNGCAVDRYLLNNLEYMTDLMAGREAHVFKYADRAQLFFQCQVSIKIKEPGQNCIRPQCAEPQRGKRQAHGLVAIDHVENVGVVDVIAQPMSALDVDSSNTTLPYQFLSPENVDRPSLSQGRKELVCLPIAVIVPLLVSCGTALLSALFVIVFCMVRRRPKHNL